MKSGQQFQRNNPFLEASQDKHPLILDGAMGSFLHRTGYNPDPVLWFSNLNIEAPEAVTEVHKSYINAGADIITTNTFRTNPASVRKQKKFTSEHLVKASVENARNAIGENHNILIAGSNPPGEDSYQTERTISYKDLSENHSKHIELLMENGCDFVLNETQSHSDEIKIICEICSKYNIPFVLSLFFDNNLNILSGEPAIGIIKLINNYNPLAVGFNCISISLFRHFLETSEFNFPWGFYLNYGLGKFTDRKITHISEPGSELKVLSLAEEKNATFAGACCGSGPEHIKYIRNFFHGNNNT